MLASCNLIYRIKQQKEREIYKKNNKHKQRNKNMRGKTKIHSTFNMVSKPS